MFLILKHIKIILKDLVIHLIAMVKEKLITNNFYLQFQNNKKWKIAEKAQKKIKFLMYNK